MADFEIEDVPFEPEEPKKILRQEPARSFVPHKQTVNLTKPVFIDGEKRGTYTGTLKHLYGYPVMIHRHPVSDNLLLVQFDFVDGREQTIFCYNWHTFLASDFEINDG